MKVLTNNVTNEFMEVIQSIIPKCSHLGYDIIKIKLGYEDKTEIDGEILKIEFDRQNEFIKNNDFEGMKILVLKKIYHTKEYLPDVLTEIFSNRKIIKEGFIKELSYYYFTLLLLRNKKIKTIEEYLEINIPWLSFKTVDEYDSKLFRDMLKNFKYDGDLDFTTEKLFSLINKPLTSLNLKNILEEYEKITKVIEKTTT